MEIQQEIGPVINELLSIIYLNMILAVIGLMAISLAIISYRNEKKHSKKELAKLIEQINLDKNQINADLSSTIDSVDVTLETTERTTANSNLG